MSSQVKSSSAKRAPKRKPSPKNQQAVRIKNFVDDQLKKTREQVKTIDLLHGILVVVAFVMACFLVAAVIDAWIWPLSQIARWFVLALVVLGSIGYVAFAIVPLIFKKINPDYAAKMIEDAKPGFKNSIINYVSFRKKPAELKPAIFDAVSRQAATDLSAVPGDATVDRTKLIRIGILLCALTLFAVAYKVFSPKDPLQSFARILAPAGDLSKPAVVTILDVDPGDTKVFFGQPLKISATVKGSHVPEDVQLTYSTLDGQLINQTVSMFPDDTPNRYTVDLSMPGGGIQQSLNYRITARDGSSRDYEAIVQPNPSIAIESLVLTPPRYTGLKERTLTGQGDIEAVEGTNVTLHGLANLPIDVAYIELLNEVEDRGFKAAAKPIEMSSEGKSCVGRFQVLLNSNRDRPLATHYRVKFVSKEGDRNQDANVYPIRVIPDLAPEIRIRNPVQTDVQIPENGTLAIDIDANDLDFKIKKIFLKMKHQGDILLEQELKKNSNDGNQRVTARYVVRPEKLGLKVGDKAIFYATASDNRISPYSDQPDPNTTKTEDYTLTILEADPEAEKEKGDTGEKDSESQPDKNDSGDQKETGESEKEGDESKEGDSDQKDGDEGSKGDKGSEGSENAQDSESEESGNEQNSKGSNEDQTSEGSKESGESSEDPSKGNQSQSGDSDSEQGDSQEQQSKDGSQSEGEEKDDQGNQSGDSSAGNQGASKEGDSQSRENGGADGNMSSDQKQAGDQSKQNGGESGNSEGLSEGDSDSGQNGGGSEGDGTQDKSLTRGKQERLPDNASEGEQFKKLKEELGIDDEKESESGKENQQEQSQDPGNGEEQKGKEGSANGNQAGTDENPDGKEKNPERNSGAQQNSDQQKKGNGQSDPQEGSGQSQNPDSDSQQPDKGGDQEKSQGPGGEKKEEPDSGNQEDDGTPKKSPSKEGSKKDNGSEQGDESESGSSSSAGSQSEGGNKSGEKEGSQKGGGQSGGESEGSEKKQGEGQGGKPSEQQNSSSQNQKQSGSQSNPSEAGKSGSRGQPGEGSEGSQTQAQDGSQSNNSSQNDSSSSSTDRQGDRSSAKSSTGNGNPGGLTGNSTVEKDKTNQEHTRKATDMILKRLAEERHNPDPDLLDKMNWDKEDLNNFLDRWEAMKKAAGTGNDVARRKYEKALKSLGMKPKSARRAVGQSKEEITGLNSDGAVNQPPPEFELDFNAFQRDLNRSDR